LLRDFELMKNNAIKFNGEISQIAQEGIAIYDFVKGRIESSRGELAALESAVDDQMSVKPKKKLEKGSKRSSSALGNTASAGGVDANLGDLSHSNADLADGSDESFTGRMEM
jgi:hypothetical protein